MVGVASSALLGLLPASLARGQLAGQGLQEAYLALCVPDGLAEGLRHACRTGARRRLAGQRLPQLAESFDRSCADGRQFPEWFKARTAQDFAEARVVKVNGWVLSESEYLLYTQDEEDAGA